MKSKRIIILSILAIAIIAIKCKEKPVEPTIDNYDRSALLTNVANAYIIPAYSNYKTEVEALHTALVNFKANPSLSNLTACRSKLTATTTAWQSIAYLEFGPAASISLRAQTNVYPVDTSLINSNINTNTYNLQLPSNFDAKGLQALDYLLYNPNYTDNDLVNYYNNSTSAQDYLIAVSSELKTNATTVVNDWQSYKSTFIGSHANNAQGSATSNLINAISLHYEAFVRKGKIGIPLGVFNGISQQTLPGHVEGLYSGNSKVYAIAAMEALTKLFKGNHFQNNAAGEGLDDYLNHVEAKKGNDDLSVAIETSINQVITQLNQLSGNINHVVTTNSSELTPIYQSMQQLVPLIKVETTAALGVLISYQDNDGD